jgi:hypothetical protein
MCLYNSLNDDEEDIRDLAAKTVSSILEISLAPPSACEEFVNWLQKVYSSSPQFSWNIICRMTRTAWATPYNPRIARLEPAKVQFEEALEEDDALFVEEEQNLFIDEVKELGLWTGLFLEVPSEVFKTPRVDDHESFMLQDFAAWVADAVSMLNKTTTRGGPLGWTSKSLGFTAAIRVLRCANAFLNYYDKYFRTSSSGNPPREQRFLHMGLNSHVENIIFELQNFCRETLNNNTHPLLIQELRGQKLLDPTPGSFFKKISLKMNDIWDVKSERSNPV